MLQQSYIQRKGAKFQKQVSEIYLHSDIGCGILGCPLCENTIKGILDPSETIYIVPHTTLILHLDLLAYSKIFQNLLIPQHILPFLSKRQRESLEQLIDHSNKNIYLYPTYYSIFTQVEKGDDEAEHSQQMTNKVLDYYSQHIECRFIVLDPDVFMSIVQKECPEYVDLLGIQPSDSYLWEQYQKNPPYAAFLSEKECIEGVKKGELFEGRYFGGKIKTQYGFDIICQPARCMNGDIVAVQIQTGQWKKIIKAGFEDEIEEQDIENVLQIIDTDNQNLKQTVNDILNNDLTPSGNVLGIIKRSDRNFCGHLEIQAPQQNSAIYKFVPADNRFPNFLVKTTQSLYLQKKKVQIKFDQWPEKSEFPFGIFVSVIGDIGNMDTEQRVILLEHNVEFRPFSKQVLDCLPDQDYQIPEEEIKRRNDLRHLPVCSVDPPGCKDIDDALHCIELPNGNFQVGVHIADVSHFVKSETPIDKEASQRCTTVYLVDRRTDMLPKLLTETLCSLRDDGDRLAFSCLVELDRQANVIKTSFCKSIIRSKKSMTYQMAQECIDDQNDHSVLTQSLRNLLNLATELKQKRNVNGALTLASTQVKFTFDQETHNPTDVAFYHTYKTNYMVEEFMLLANIKVAEQIFEHYPASAILRKHSSPKPKQIKDFAKLLSSMGYDYYYDTSKQLQESLDSISRQNDPFFNKLIRILTTRTMNEANYFCTADFDFPEFNHYGLACSLYTHFTSPIRRYADVLVHRLLAASIDVESLPNKLTSPPLLTKQCFQLNLKNRNARNASRASSDYHQYLFFQQNPVSSTGYITSIEQNTISILMEKYGLEGKIELDSEGKETEGIPYIEFKGMILKIFDVLEVNVKVTLQGFKKVIHMDIIRKIPKL